MPNIDTMVAPLVLRTDGEESVIAAAFTHPSGLLYLDLFWHLSTPNKAVHLIKGEITGDGPWKIANSVIRVLGCNHTDPHLQDQYGPWQEYLQSEGDKYPPREQIIEIAQKLGATPQLDNSLA